MKPLIIKKFTTGRLRSNTYVIKDGESFCIVIDPGEHPEEFIRYIGKNKIDYILLTHCHYDHISGLNTLRRHTDASVVVHQAEADWLLDSNLNRSMQTEHPFICEWPDVLLNGEELIKCGPHTIKVIHTPGHSPGSVCYLINDNYLFSGDTLLAGLVGPTNLPFSDRDLLKHSVINSLFTLDSHIKVYPGHGEESSIGLEKEFNLLPNIKNMF